MELWTLAIMPVVVLLVPLVWKDLISPRVNPPEEKQQTKDDTAVTVGQPVDFASAAVTSLTEQLAEERAQHDRCDALLDQHGHDIPHN